MPTANQRFLNPRRLGQPFLTKLLAPAIAIAIVGGVEFAIIWASTSAERKFIPPQGIECGLTIEDDSIELGELPNFQVRLTNAMDQPIFLVRSMFSVFPECEFIVEGPGVKDVKNRPASDCGTSISFGLYDELFKRIGPGDSFDPFEMIDPDNEYPALKVDQYTFDEPGQYSIQFRYSTMRDDEYGYKSSLERFGFGLGTNMLAKLPRLEVYSNTVTLTIVDPEQRNAGG